MKPGPWHYEEAERLLFETLPGAHLPDEVVARAQVHATLANAAAAALNDNNGRRDEGGLPKYDWLEWVRVAGTPDPRQEARRA